MNTREPATPSRPLTASPVFWCAVVALLAITGVVLYYQFRPQPAPLESRIKHGDMLWAQDEYEKAEADHRAVLAVQERALGPENPYTLKSRQHLADTLQKQRKYAEAEAELLALLVAQERVPDSSLTYTRAKLAAALWAQGKYAEAGVQHRILIAAQEHNRYQISSEQFLSHYHMAQWIEKQGDDKAAAKNYEDARRLWEDALAYAQTEQQRGQLVFGNKHPRKLNNEKLVKRLEEKLRNLPPEK